MVEPVLSKDKCVLLKDHNAVTPVRLKPAAPWSRVKHSTTEALRSHDDLGQTVCKGYQQKERKELKAAQKNSLISHFS